MSRTRFLPLWPAALLLALPLALTACGKKPGFPAAPPDAEPARFYPDPALDPQPAKPPAAGTATQGGQPGATQPGASQPGATPGTAPSDTPSAEDALKPVDPIARRPGSRGSPAIPPSGGGM